MTRGAGALAKRGRAGQNREEMGGGVRPFAALLAALAAACLAVPAGARETGAPPPPGEVGIFEKLGAQVPLDLTLVDEQGRKVALGTLLDRPALLTLNYFRCAGVCTPQLNNLADTLQRVDLAPGVDFKVLTVSFDDRDTAEIAAQKRENYLKLMKRPFPAEGWRFLTGDAASTKALADAVGFKFQKQGDGFAHAAAIIVLSPRGDVTRYLYGQNYSPAELATVVGLAAQGIATPTVNKWLSFCLNYDSQGKRYVLDVTRVGGAVTLLATGVLLAAVFLRGRSRKRGAAARGAGSAAAP
jgi:protein SCO1